jgi:hypothetical protein
MGVRRRCARETGAGVYEDDGSALFQQHRHPVKHGVELLGVRLHFPRNLHKPAPAAPVLFAI